MMQTLQMVSPAGELLRFADAPTLAAAAARDLRTWVRSHGESGPPLLIALSGGRIAATFFPAAAAAFASAKADLARVHFFWADERCVPPVDSESNFRLASERLLKPLEVPAGNVHRIRGELVPAAAAVAAATELRDLCQRAGRAVGFDLVLLGMGEDGHVASLFPGESSTQISAEALYREVVATKPPPHRVTVGYPLLRGAGQIWVLASGAGKEHALRLSLGTEVSTPLGRVLHARPQTRIYTDLGGC